MNNRELRARKDSRFNSNNLKSNVERALCIHGPYPFPAGERKGFVFEAEVGALTVLPCACHFQPARQHFSCYKWQTVILKARHDEGGRGRKIYRRRGVSAPGGRILSLSTLRLLPNHPCQEEMETPGPVHTAWEALRKFTIMDAGSSCTACVCLHCVQVLLVWKKCVLGAPRLAGMPFLSEAHQSFRQTRTMGLGPERLNTTACKLPESQHGPVFASTIIFAWTVLSFGELAKLCIHGVSLYLPNTHTQTYITQSFRTQIDL